jgi:hypothetical protein
MDIVERMRRGEPCADFGVDKTCRAKEARSGCTCAEVADEIERLRAEHRILLGLIENDALLLERFNAAVERRTHEQSADKP